jgi:Tfp pilus assembly pilus retraction ATPase PilT
MDSSPQSEPQINKLFRLARKHQASDLYLDAGSPPRMKLQGTSRVLEIRPLSRNDLDCLLSPILYADQRERVERGEDVSFSYTCEEGTSYYVSISQRNGEIRLSAHRVGAD